MKIIMQVIGLGIVNIGEPVIFEHSNKGVCTKFINKWAKTHIVAEETERSTEEVRYFNALPRNKRNIVIWITTHDERYKMAGIRSFSTSVYWNKNCEKYAQIEGSVCQFCYARAQLRYKKGLRDWTEWNYTVLNMGVLRKEDLPTFDDKVMRIESDGDAATRYAVRNEVNICNKNKGTCFSAWTKNKFLFNPVLDEMGKPKNMILVHSGLMLNKVIAKDKYDDKVFVVCNDGRPSNCAGFGCKHQCGKCYGMKAKKTDDVIVETLRLPGKSKK